jgi:hypothetical protein
MMRMRRTIPKPEDFGHTSKFIYIVPLKILINNYPIKIRLHAKT